MISSSFNASLQAVRTAITYVKGTPVAPSDVQFTTEEYDDTVVICEALPTTQLATQTVVDYVELALALSTLS